MIKAREVKKIIKELVANATNSQTFNRHTAGICAQKGLVSIQTWSTLANHGGRLPTSSSI